ncbi:Uncharacterized protein SCG7086_AB_00190 [Chlamydiales bacterium SCGC AG-110-P3]|nr:Uncharacterized protein SCG7086_AB_00190 [Chlamydiales bacterium SCGC AG-110-P3]
MTEKDSEHKKHLEDPDALIKRLSSPDQLDKLLIITSTRTWIALYAILSVVVVIILWALFGSIPIKVEGRCVVLNRTGLFSIHTRVSGMVQGVTLEPGDQVKKGQTVGTIFDAEEELKLRSAQAQVEFLQVDFERFETLIKAEWKAKKLALETDVEAHEFSARLLAEQIPALELRLEANEELFKKGLIPLAAVIDSEQLLSQKKIELENTRAGLESLKAELARGYRTEEYKSKETALRELVNQRDLLLMRQEFATVISPEDGTVLEVLVSEGDIVDVGTFLIWMERPTRPEDTHLIYGYVPVEMGKRIKTGANVQVELSNINSQEFGALRGQVTEVSQYAVSDEHIGKMIKNAALVKYLTGSSSTVIEIVIEPKIDFNTVSGYAWTSGEGPPFNISTGSVGTVKAIVERVRPIYYVLPLWFLKEGT